MTLPTFQNCIKVTHHTTRFQYELTWNKPTWFCLAKPFETSCFGLFGDGRTMAWYRNV